MEETVHIIITAHASLSGKENNVRQVCKSVNSPCN